MRWIAIGTLSDIPQRGARAIETPQGRVAVFRTADDRILAIDDRCPHKGGQLSQGIVFDRRVACPLHGMTIHLDSGKAQAPDEGCTHKYRVRVDKGVVFLNLG